MTSKIRDALTFSSSHSTLIDPFLRDSQTQSPPSKPFVTLTFATSLDSSLALSPGTQTVLSGPESKSMTHYLRSHHDAILVGVNTAIADNPSLNCRISGVGGYGGEDLAGQPRPVIIDPKGRWNVDRKEGWKVLELARAGRGRAPWVITLAGTEVSESQRTALEAAGGKYFQIPIDEGHTRMGWGGILELLGGEGVQSVMIEGGGEVINGLLSPSFFHRVDSVIVTIAPTWLGKGGVMVCPDERRDEDGNKIPVGRLKDVRWVPLGEDVVLCGRPNV